MDRYVVVLLVEDSPADRRLTTEVLKETDLAIKLFCVETGEEALSWLRREGPHAEAPKPDLVLLDLGLPGMSGQDVLRGVREDDSLRGIPVVALTGSENERDELDSLGLGAHDYISKPIDRSQFQGLIEYITEYA